MAVHFKLIDVSRSDGLGAPATSSAQKAAGLRLSHEEAYAIRGATLAACERVVSLTGDIADKTGKEWLRSMTAMNLCVPVKSRLIFCRSEFADSGLAATATCGRRRKTESSEISLDSRSPIHTSTEGRI